MNEHPQEPMPEQEIGQPTPAPVTEKGLMMRLLHRGVKFLLKGLLNAVLGAALAVVYTAGLAVRLGGPALYIWLALQAWPVLAGLYGATLPHLRYALLAVVLSATLLPVAYVGARRPAWIWGAFYPSAALLWLARAWLPRLWPRFGLLFLLAVPGAYIVLTALLIARKRAFHNLSPTPQEVPHV